jgi:hypothetical protein
MFSASSPSGNAKRATVFLRAAGAALSDDAARRNGRDDWLRELASNCIVRAREGARVRRGGAAH